MSRRKTVVRIAELLGIRYANAVRLIRLASAEIGGDAPFSDLALACRRLKEKEEKR